MNDVQLKKIIDHQSKTIKKVVNKTIKETVNGKIDKIDKKLDDYIIVDVAWKDKDREWKSEMQEYRKEKLEPIVETSGHAAWLTESFKAVLALIILIGGAIAMLSKYI